MVCNPLQSRLSQTKEDSEAMYRHVLDVREKTLGPQHANTLRAKANLAEAWQNETAFIVWKPWGCIMRLYSRRSIPNNDVQSSIDLHLLVVPLRMLCTCLTFNSPKARRPEFLCFFISCWAFLIYLSLAPCFLHLIILHFASLCHFARSP